MPIFRKKPLSEADLAWREACRDCRERSKEWTEEDRKSFGDYGHHCNMTPYVILPALALAALLALCFRLAHLL